MRTPYLNPQATQNYISGIFPYPSKVFVSHSVISNSLGPHGLSPWNSPGKNTGVGSHSLLQGIFLTQGSNPGHLHCRRILYHWNHQGSPSPYPSHLIKIPLSDHTASSRWSELPLRAQGHVSFCPHDGMARCRGMAGAPFGLTSGRE